MESLKAMKVQVAFKGILKDWLGSGQAEFELPEPARFQDLMSEIKRRFGKKMPKALWDQKQNRFSESVAAIIDPTGEKIEDLNATLHDGQKISFFLIALGG